MKKHPYGGELQRKVSQNIRRLRLEKGITQKVLSLDVGISRSYLAKIERNLSSPSLAVTKRLAEALGVSINDLVK